MSKDSGRVPQAAPGSREPSREGVSAASGFDPSRFVMHVCGENPLFPPGRMGCGLPINQCSEVYRCTDCTVPFHRECARRHFGEHRAKGDTKAWLAAWLRGEQLYHEADALLDGDLPDILAEVALAALAAAMPPRDSDRSARQGGETALAGSTEGESAGRSEAKASPKGEGHG